MRDLEEQEKKLVEFGEVEVAVHPWLVPEADVSLDFLLVHCTLLIMTNDTRVCEDTDHVDGFHSWAGYILKVIHYSYKLLFVISTVIQLTHFTFLF